METHKLPIAGFVMVFLIFLFSCFFCITAGYSQSANETRDKEFINAETVADYEQYIEKYKPDELAFVAVQVLAGPYLREKEWLGAIEVFRKYQGYFPEMEDSFDKIIALLEAPEECLAVKNLGPGVNTDKGEYIPVISSDGEKIYFTRRILELIFKDNKFVYEEREEIFVTTFITEPDSQYWQKSVNIGSPINTKSHEAPMGISADGTTLLLFGNYNDSFGRGDIFYTDKTDTGWSEVKHYPAPINSKYFDADAMLTADGKAIIFVSDRPGGVGEFRKRGKSFARGNYRGNTDIYVSAKTDSNWSDPINLGDIINTRYCERTPFFHPDGKTLYFSSDGHYGLVYLVVFKTTRLNDTSWTEWSEPINLGKQYNGPGMDLGYKISTSGDLAYFSISNRQDGFGKYDIYSIELKEKPKPVTTIAGKVTDPNGNPLAVEILWNDLTLTKEAGEARSDPQTGEYFIVLPAGHEYSYYANKEYYFGKSEHLDLTDKKDYAEYTLNIMLYPVEQLKKEDVNITIIFENIFFDVDKWKLKDKSVMELERWVNLLQNHSEITLKIQGHADNTGTEKYNQVLSERRAQSVKNFLVKEGIEKNRLLATGFGESRPVATNKTEEGKRNNRRVEAQFGEMAAK